LNTTDAYQEMYDGFVNATSCAHLVGKSESLECLRKLPFEKVNDVLKATSSGLYWAPVIDGDFIQNYPSVQIENGNFPKIPITIGENSDEGTAFGRRGIDSDEELVEAIKQTFLPAWVEDTTGKSVDGLAREILGAYPDDQEVGIPPLKTWPDVIKPGSDEASEYGLRYRRANAIFGDVFG
jgi:carboxylesterase type B